MPVYANRGGASSVRHYQYDDTSLTVWFADGSVYVYDYASAGKANIERAKKLADAGIGLGSWIQRVMRKSYSSKSKS